MRFLEDLALFAQNATNSSAGASKLALDFAVAALRGGDLLEAQRLLRAQLAANPNDAAVCAMLAEIANDQRRVEEGTVMLRRASVIDPSLERKLALIYQLQTWAGPAATLHEIEGLPPEFRQTFAVAALEAAQLGVLGMHDPQIALYERLVGEHPGNGALLMILGNAYKTVGRTEEAVAALRRAIAVRPTYGEAYWTLANFKSFRFAEADLSAMRKAVRRKLDDDDALHFHFSLGKAYEDRGEFAASFLHYVTGNGIRAASFTPDQMSATRFVNAAIATFQPALFKRHAESGNPSSDPIFVLGLHRSGSTLVEQILVSHPLIEGTTELLVMQQLWDRIGREAAVHGGGTFEQITRLDSAALRSIGDEYLERTRPFRLTDRPYFVDKLPANWMNIGLIRLALPNAKIIDARRHPLACGFSNFKQHYDNGVAYAYSQESIGYFYRDCWRLMSHLDQIQPGAMHRILNERLIDDPEGEVRRMLDYLGLPFDPACLEFHSNKRAVSTPSAEQVRRPINRDGTDYWRRYEAWLGPLKTALGQSLEFWDHPAIKP